MADKKITFSENLWYCGANLMTLGFWYTLKIVIKKAMLETK